MINIDCTLLSSDIFISTYDDHATIGITRRKGRYRVPVVITNRDYCCPDWFFVEGLRSALKAGFSWNARTGLKGTSSLPCTRG